VDEDVAAADFAQEDVVSGIVEEGDDLPRKAIVSVEEVAEGEV
jgi:hypothetical protein